MEFETNPLRTLVDTAWYYAKLRLTHCAMHTVQLAGSKGEGHGSGREAGQRMCAVETVSAALTVYTACLLVQL